VVETGDPQALFGQPRDARTQAFVAVLREAAAF
jgi:ABC-type histidine transport system ATPase subunit